MLVRALGAAIRSAQSGEARRASLLFEAGIYDEAETAISGLLAATGPPAFFREAPQELLQSIQTARLLDSAHFQ
ncbi:MAG TPA: hypothetical protein DD490_10955 [Acidobacteria bacterium]|nr:hypothetical protein [Acidobacteriota bacterium]